MSWLVWHLPAFMLDWISYTSDSLRGQVEAIYKKADITPNLGGIFGGHIDVIDMTALILSPPCRCRRAQRQSSRHRV